MALNIIGGNNLITIDEVKFDETNNQFCCYSSDLLTEALFTHELPFVLDEVPSAEFTEKIYFFKNELFQNKKVLSVEMRERSGSNKAVGFIFSLEDLMNSPEIFDTLVLRKIIFNVIKKLLSEETLSIKSKPTSWRQDEDYKLNDFYDSDSLIMVICDQFVNFPNYEFSNYLIKLFKYGFKYCPSHSFFPVPNNLNLVEENYNSLTKRIKLSASANELNKNFFVNQLISNSLYLQNNEVARFHMYYQAIEMLMEVVFKNEIKENIYDKNLDDLTGHGMKDFFREAMRDSSSLEKVIGGKYSDVDTLIKDEFLLRMEEFLSYIKMPVSESLPSRLYKVRNTLFHSFNKVLADSTLDKYIVDSHLKKTNDLFEYFVMELIYTFKTV